MMKKVFNMQKLVFTLIMAVFPILAYCQRGTIDLGLFAQGGGFSKKFTPYEVGFVLNYEILNRFSIGLQAEHNISLFKEDNIKSYTTSETIEGKIGYSAYRDENYDLSIVLGIGCPARSNNDWNYAFYEAGIKCKFANSSKIKPFMGLSLREYDSHTKVTGNHLCLMGTLGLDVNL